jgi:hypothetical protein
MRVPWIFTKVAGEIQGDDGGNPRLMGEIQGTAGKSKERWVESKEHDFPSFPSFRTTKQWKESHHGGGGGGLISRNIEYLGILNIPEQRKSRDIGYLGI